MKISDLKDILESKHYALDMAKQDLLEISENIVKEKAKIELREKCRVLIMELGKQTQAQIQQYIEDTVTLALQSVYGQAYRFVVQFEYNKRDQLEVQFFLDKGGNLLEIRRNTTGGGVVDLCAFSLRMVVWVLDDAVISPPVMILDEPFKNVSARFIPTVSETVKKISEMLAIQFIIVTHNATFIENADLVHYIGDN
jgi:ABC-type molybdenum transport system ATPase subunit/photorepair protein PhrA